MTDEQAERIASTLETLVKQNEQIILRLSVIANSSPQKHGAGLTTYYFGQANAFGTVTPGFSDMSAHERP